MSNWASPRQYAVAFLVVLGAQSVMERLVGGDEEVLRASRIELESPDGGGKVVLSATSQMARAAFSFDGSASQLLLHASEDGALVVLKSGDLSQEVWLSANVEASTLRLLNRPDPRVRVGPPNGEMNLAVVPGGAARLSAESNAGAETGVELRSAEKEWVKRVSAQE